MFDHLGIVVKDLSIAEPFYSACLAPLGISCIQDNSVTSTEGWLVFGTDAESPFFVVACGVPGFWREHSVVGASPIHIAFQAPNVEAVDQFYLAGLAHGGEDNGAPGPRQATTAYYAAYLIDPDGNNLEAGHRAKLA